MNIFMKVLDVLIELIPFLPDEEREAAATTLADLRTNLTPTAVGRQNALADELERKKFGG